MLMALGVSMCYADSFHPLTGFPPEIVHDPFTVIVPVELAMCPKKLIVRGYMSLDALNRCIVLLVYKNGGIHF